MVIQKAKIFTMRDLRRLKLGTEIKLVELEGFKSHRFLNINKKIVDKQINAFRFEDGGFLKLPDKKEFEGWEKGFIVNGGIGSSFPFTLKYEVLG